MKNSHELPEVYILLSTYNGHDFLSELLDSIIAQSYQRWKILVRDDGSVDDTLAIINRYTHKVPGRIELLEDDCGNVGPVRSFSLLLEGSDAEYVMFCDQDDVWLENKISISVERMLEEERSGSSDIPILVHSDLKVTDKSLNIISESFWRYQGLNPERMCYLKNLLIQNHVTGCATMLNRRLAMMSRNIPDGVIMHDWWAALIAVTCGRLAHIDEPTILYRQHGGNDTGAKKWGISYIFKTLHKLPSMWGGFEVTRNQAYGVLRFESEYTDLGYGDTIRRYVSLFDMRWPKRKLSALRLGVYKYGFLRNLGMFVLL